MTCFKINCVVPGFSTVVAVGYMQRSGLLGSYLGVAAASLGAGGIVPFEEDCRGAFTCCKLSRDCESNDACADDLFRVNWSSWVVAVEF
jgi:hypothetical protein